MGLWSKIKGWLNIGGVSVKITQVEDPFPEGDTLMKGKYVLTTKTTRTILSTTCEFYMERTTKDKEGKDQVSRTSLGKQSSKDYMVNDAYPFELAEGETKELDIFIHDVDIGGITGRMAKSGGMMGMLGKAAQFAGSLGDQGIVRYYVEVSADVKGTPLDPSDKREIRVMPGKS